MEETQMSLEDFNIETSDDMTEEVKEAELSTLTNENLIVIIEELRKANTSYDEQIKTIHDHYNKEMGEMNSYYNSKLTEKNNLISYYDRKFKLIKDIIVIEAGEVK